MPFFCYIHRSSGGAPHFEVLPDIEIDGALWRARRLLAERRDGERAEIWEGETLVATLERAEA